VSTVAVWCDSTSSARVIAVLLGRKGWAEG
jgi:hypothetical protein